MACTIHPADSQLDAGTGPQPARAMTRCECACLSFAEIRQKIRTEGVSLAQVARRTGCGATCTACLPDLRAFLARG